MNAEEFRLASKWDNDLKVGDDVVVFWTAGGYHFSADGSMRCPMAMPSSVMKSGWITDSRSSSTNRATGPSSKGGGTMTNQASQDRAIFVFGSNLAGRHGKGAALHARNHYGAKYGIGVGRTGHAYAIPTKDAYIKTLPLDKIAVYVADFIVYAKHNSNLTFEVTRIGSGAGRLLR